MRYLRYIWNYIFSSSEDRARLMPLSGSFTAHKKAICKKTGNEVIVELLVPAHALRVQVLKGSNVQRVGCVPYKARVSEAEVISIRPRWKSDEVSDTAKPIMYNHPGVEYVVGQSVYSCDVDEEAGRYFETRYLTCAEGIHLFMRREDAERYECREVRIMSSHYDDELRQARLACDPPDAGKMRPGEGFIILGFFIGIMWCLFWLADNDLKNHPDTFEHYHGSSE